MMGGMRLGALVRSYRVQHKLSVRKVAKEIGVDHSALFRLEQGAEPAFNQFRKVLLWLLK